MPTYEIKSPDGSIYHVDAPEGASEQDALKYVQGNHDTLKSLSTGEASKYATAPSRFVEGLKDPVYGAAQLASHLAPDSVVAKVAQGGETMFGLPENALPRSSAEIDARLKTREQNIGAGAARDENAGRRSYLKNLADRGLANQGELAELQTLTTDPNKAPAQAIDVARLAGNFTNPVNYAVPGSAEASTAQTLLRGGAQGAVSAAAQPVTDENFWGGKAVQTVTGVGASMGGAYVLGKLTRALAPLIGGPRSAGQSADDILSEGAQRAEIDLDTIPRNVLESLRQDVHAALLAGRELDPDAVIRAAQFRTLGVEPTLGQLTREPVQYTRELNARGVEGAGEPLANRFADQNRQLIEALNTRGASAAPDAYQVGQRVAGTLQAGDETARQGVDAAYTAARATTGKDALIDPGFAGAAQKSLNDSMLRHWLPPQVQNTLDDIAQGKLNLTVKTATELDSVLSKAQRGSGDDASKKAIGVVRDALNQAEIAPLPSEAQGAGVTAALGNPVEQAGEDTRQAFAQARSLAKARFDNIKATPALKAVLDEAAPDGLFQKFVLNGNVSDLQALRRNLDRPTTDAVRGGIMGWLKGQALSGAADETGKFSQSAFNKALTRVGPRLQVFFSPREIAELRMVGRVASYIQSRPAGAAVNESNTAAAVMNLASKIGGHAPGMVGDAIKFAATPIRRFGEIRAAEKALRAELGREPSEFAIDTLRDIIPLTGIAGSAAAGATQGAQ